MRADTPVAQKVRQAAHVAGASVLVRLIHALSALVLTYAFGTTPETDRYMAFTMAVVAACTLASIAVPSLAGAFIARVGSISDAQAALRKWAHRLGLGAMGAFALLIPGLAWLMTPDSPQRVPHAWELGQLLMMAIPCVGLAGRCAVEQAMLQARGRLVTGVWAGGWNTLTTASFLLLAAVLADVRWAAAGMTAGALAEWLWLRRCNKRAAYEDRTAADPLLAASSAREPLPSGPVTTWRPWLALTFASLASFVVGPLDQVWLADLGLRAQAVWGLGSRIPSFLTLSLFVVVSVLSTAAAAQWGQDRKRSALHGLKLAGAALVCGAGVLGLAAWQAEPLVAALYQRGSFTPQDSLDTAQALRDAIWAYPLYPVSVALVRGASMTGLQRTLLASAAVFLVTKAVVAAWAVPHWGLTAIGASTLAATAAQSLVLSIALWAQTREASPLGQVRPEAA